MTGKFTWRGQQVSFEPQVAPADFLSSHSIRKAKGPVSLSVASEYLSASPNGIVGGGGTFNSQVSATSPSLDRLLGWLGHGGSSGLRDFVFKGSIDAGPQGVAFTKANIGLNGMKASGGGSVAIGSPLNIRTALKFAKLDFSAFAGKGGGTGTKDRSTPAPATLPSTFRFSRGWTRGPNVAADEIGYAKVFAGPVRTTLVVKGGAANLTVPQSPFYGGTLAAKLTADGSGDVPAIKLDMAIAGAAAAPLLHDAARFDR